MHHPSCPLRSGSHSPCAASLASPIPCELYWAARGTFRWLTCISVPVCCSGWRNQVCLYLYATARGQAEAPYLQGKPAECLTGEMRDRTGLLLQSWVQVNVSWHISINLGAFHLSFTTIGMSQIICLAWVKLSSVSFLALRVPLCTSQTWRTLATSLMSQCSELRPCYLLVPLKAKRSSRIFYFERTFGYCPGKLLRIFL